MKAKSIDSDIFISHSHGDRDNAISLAGYLKQNFGINAFIDSCIWGNSSVLLKKIDNEYCKNINEQTYSYEKRNESTSHVHMMLSVALTKMINKTECLFFLNTPNSVTSSGVVNKTASPWIYSEIATAQMIRKPLEFHRQLGTKYFSKGGILNERLNVEYDLQLDDFFELDADDLKAWSINWKVNKRGNSLDNLYKLHPPLNSVIHS
ncbi:MAG: toll/interleukin-1 receptor domain-containing protein [Chitinophagaceae bacterium]|nr:toll/interleukin-1 receptor domain-containing protein [Chitinophagaceae bacterium]